MSNEQKDDMISHATDVLYVTVFAPINSLDHWLRGRGAAVQTSRQLTLARAPRDMIHHAEILDALVDFAQ